MDAPLDLNPYFKSGKTGDNLIPVSSDLSLNCSRNDGSRKRKKSSYEMFCKEFADIMERADSKNESVVKLISEKFSEMKIAVLQEMMKCTPNTTTDGIASFPAYEKCFNRKRLAPPSSPSQRKTK